MSELLNPELIRVAVQSPLGILALMIVVLGNLAALFFRQAPVQVRVMIFVLIFGGVVAFGFAVIRAAPYVDVGTRSQTPTNPMTLPPADTGKQPMSTLDFP